MHQSSSAEAASPGGRRLSRSFHSCLRGADNDDQESGINKIIKINKIVFIMIDHVCYIKSACSIYVAKYQDDFHFQKRFLDK